MSKSAAKQIKVENGKEQENAAESKNANSVSQYDEKSTNNSSGSSENQKNGFLSDKSDLVNQYAQLTVEKANEIGNRAAEVFASSSDYLKNIDFEQTKQQIKNTITEKPALSLAVAGAFGVLVGLLIGRKSA